MLKNRFDIIFDKLFYFVGRNKIVFLVLFFALIAVSFVQIVRQNFVNDVSIMLPDSPELKRSLNFINNSDMSDTIAFSISYKTNSNNNLIPITDEFTEELKKLNFITDVTAGIENLDITQIKKDLATLLPLLLNKDD
jgi:predicted RND superfamily exporter protein